MGQNPFYKYPAGFITWKHRLILWIFPTYVQFHDGKAYFYKTAFGKLWVMGEEDL